MNHRTLTMTNLLNLTHTTWVLLRWPVHRHAAVDENELFLLGAVRPLQHNYLRREKSRGRGAGAYKLPERQVEVAILPWREIPAARACTRLWSMHCSRSRAP